MPRLAARNTRSNAFFASDDAQFETDMLEAWEIAQEDADLGVELDGFSSRRRELYADSHPYSDSVYNLAA